MSNYKQKLNEKIEYGMKVESFFNVCSYWFLKVLLFLIPPYSKKK